MKTELTEKARKARNEYARKWRAKHKEYIKAYTKEWREKNPDKVQATLNRYWEKKAQEATEQ